MNSSSFIQRLEFLAKRGQSSNLSLGLKGLEKESLRITDDGRIAQTPHFSSLGSALTHPYITTDYSEALLEFITPPYPQGLATLAFLDDIHRFVFHHLPPQEQLLATSMPCEFDQDQDIPIARYGDSNIGQMKYVYRLGLSYRYGRTMQAIAGIHFNYSIHEGLWPVLQALFSSDRETEAFKSEAYFALIRNFQRCGWLLLYLFGASPAVCKNFLECRKEIPSNFSKFNHNTYYAPFATSLRMSDIGYKNQTQSKLYINLNSLDDYVASLCHAIETPHPPYEAIGIKVEGQYRQLNANILQIENEFYSPVRPKQITRSGEKPTLALKRRGVRYIEVRSLDLNPFEPLGIHHSQMLFLEALLLYCLIKPSPPLSHPENQAIQANLLATAYRGRDPALTLNQNGRPILLRKWAQSLCFELQSLCEMLDQQHSGTPYQDSLADQMEKVQYPEKTPSAQMLSEMQKHNESFAGFALRRSQIHADYFRGRPLSSDKLAQLNQVARESLAEQKRIEATDQMDFDEFLRRYFAQTCAHP